MMDDKENTFRFLDKALAEHDFDLEIKANRDFDFLHADPRYAALLRRLGLPA